MAAIHDLIAQVVDEQRCERLAAADGVQLFVRMEFNAKAAIQQVLLISPAAQRDPLFEGVR